MSSQLAVSQGPSYQRQPAHRKNVRFLRVDVGLSRLSEEIRRLSLSCDQSALISLHRQLQVAAARADLNTIECFETVLNTTLDSGFRGPQIIGFIYDVLFERFSARIRRRLATSRRGINPADVEDLLGVTIEAVQSLISNANRTRHTLTYALLLAIAEHRTIDYLRRKKPELTDQIESFQTTSLWNPGQDSRVRPDVQLENQERLEIARELRAAVLRAVNDLPDVQRKALVLVEVEGLGYDDIAHRLNLKRTDVGNLVRRARLQRDRNLMPYLRVLKSLDGHVGFKRIQDNRTLRVNLLRWTTEMGDGVCRACLNRSYRLHTASESCFPIDSADICPSDNVLVV